MRRVVERTSEAAGGRFLLALGLSVAVGGPLLLCEAQRLVGAARANKPTLPEQALAVPLVRQETDFSCGPAALLAVLRYLGAWKGRESQLYPVLSTSPDHGTLPENLVVGARRFGLNATVEQSMSLERLRTLFGLRRLIIVELQAWRDAERQNVAWRDNWDDGHFVVLVGLDAEFAYFMDPSTGGAYTYLPLTELLERWHDLNQVRKDPRTWRDLRLGVIIGGTPRAPHRKLPTHRLVRQE